MPPSSEGALTHCASACSSGKPLAVRSQLLPFHFHPLYFCPLQLVHASCLWVTPAPSPQSLPPAVLSLGRDCSSQVKSSPKTFSDHSLPRENGSVVLFFLDGISGGHVSFLWGLSKSGSGFTEHKRVEYWNEHKSTMFRPPAGCLGHRK